MRSRRRRPARSPHGRTRAAVVLAASLVLAAACADAGGRPPAADADPARPTPESFGRPPLEPRLEPASAVTATLGPGGGVLTATATDGAVFRLTVPPGALEERVALTATPAGAVGGLPLAGGLAAAVALEPAGLAFALPVQLTVELPAAPGGKLAGFAWTGPDAAFRIHPWWVEPGGRTAHLTLAHFSGYGLGIPGPSQLDAVAGELILLATEEDAADWLDACLQDAAAPCSEADVEAAHAAWYDAIVAPRLQAGPESVAQAIAAHAAYRDWRSFLLLIIAGDDPDGPTVPPPLATRRDAGRAENHATLRAHFDAHVRPACSGPVPDWKDWLRVPDELRLTAAQLYGGSDLAAFPPLSSPEEPGAVGEEGNSCVRLDIVDVGFPQTLGPDQTEATLTLRTVVTPPAGAPLPVAATVALEYTPGASGPAALATGADGTLSVPVALDPAVAGGALVGVSLTAVEAALGRPEVLTAQTVVFANQGDVFFEDNLTPGPRPVLAPGSEHELAVFVRVEPAAGHAVTLALDGPGLLAGGTAPIEAVTADFAGVGLVTAPYTAPGGPVADGVVARLTATAVIDGAEHADTLTLFPYWAALTIEADVGGGFVPATNQAVAAEGDGPFPIRGRVLAAGATTADPAQPLPDALVLVTTAEQTLEAPGGGCCSATLTAFTDAEGWAALAWRANGTPTEDHLIELLHGVPGVSFVAATVTIDRGAAAVAVAAAFPPQVTPGAAETLVVTVSDAATGAPLEGAFVSLSATGGTVGEAEGTTDADGQFSAQVTLDAGSAGLTVDIAVRLVPGGPVVAMATVTATAPAASVEELWVGSHTTVYSGCDDPDETGPAPAWIQLETHPTFGLLVRTVDRFDGEGYQFEEFEASFDGVTLTGTRVRHGEQPYGGVAVEAPYPPDEQLPLEGTLEDDGTLSVRAAQTGTLAQPWCGAYSRYSVRPATDYEPVDLTGTWLSDSPPGTWRSLELVQSDADLTGTVVHDVLGTAPLTGRVVGERVVGLTSGTFPDSSFRWRISLAIEDGATALWRGNLRFVRE